MSSSARLVQWFSYSDAAAADIITTALSFEIFGCKSMLIRGELSLFGQRWGAVEAKFGRRLIDLVLREAEGLLALARRSSLEQIMTRYRIIWVISK